LKIAYLLNTYPVVSATFIRREIEGLESRGLEIERFAARKWAGSLVDPKDIAEQNRTQYLLTGNLIGLIVAVVNELVQNPSGILRALHAWLNLLRRSKGRIIRHIAYFMEAVYFLQLARKKGIDHVHTHFATNATAVAMLAHLMGGPSYSFTVHGPDEFTDSRWLSFDAKVRNATFVVAISNYCRSELLKLSSPDQWSKILIARCGIALEDLEPLRDVDGTNQTLICVGRLCRQKGQVLIPPVVAGLREAFPGLRVILVGDGESRRVVEDAVATWRLADVVEIRGWLANDKVLALVRTSRALLLPSYAEGLPIVIMEALALGRPVISTTVAGIPELVDESCGWLFDPGNTDQMASAIRDCLTCSPAKLLQMGLAGRSRVVELHDIRTHVQILHKRFQDTLAEAYHGSVAEDRVAQK
jgi:colanic acid/amylovoran biosynthesis glycosyltransferase